MKPFGAVVILLACCRPIAPASQPGMSMPAAKSLAAVLPATVAQPSEPTLSPAMVPWMAEAIRKNSLATGSVVPDWHAPMTEILDVKTTNQVVPDATFNYTVRPFAVELTPPVINTQAVTFAADVRVTCDRSIVPHPEQLTYQWELVDANGKRILAGPSGVIDASALPPCSAKIVKPVSASLRQPVPAVTP